VHAARQFVLDRGECGLERNATGRIEKVDRLAEFAIHRRILCRLRQRSFIRIDAQVAALAAIIGDAGFRRDPIEGVAAVEGEGQGRFRIHAPLIALTKAAIIRQGVALGVDFARTLSSGPPSCERRAVMPSGS